MQRRVFSRLVSILLALTLVQLLQLSMNLPAQAATSQLDSGALTQTGLTPNSYTFYGSNHSWMLAATNDWYQHQGNWCGIANIRAIQVYDWLYYNGKAPGWDNSQEAIHNLLHSYSSPWCHGSGGYVYSDNAGERGIDPHSIAYLAW